MREIIKYEALDGKLFDYKEECEDYESNHPFFNPKAIKFYSMNGKKIKDPNESVFLDCNQFIAFTKEALLTYIKYRERLGLKTPTLPNMPVLYPLHYIFRDGVWQCYEEIIASFTYGIKHDFENEYEENEEDYHNLIEGVPIDE